MGRRQSQAVGRIPGSLLRRFRMPSPERDSVLALRFTQRLLAGLLFALPAALLFSTILCLPASSQASERKTISVASLKAPEKAREELLKAMLAFRKNNLPETEKRLDIALTVAPDYAEALSFRGFLEVNARRFEAAMSDLQHALRIDPAFPMSYLYMGSLLNHLGRYDEALSSLEHLTQLDPQSWACAYERARSWLGKHDYANALAEVNRAATLGGEAKMGNAMRLLRGHALYGLKQYGQARIELAAYLAAEPNGNLASIAQDLMGRIERESVMAER